MVLLLPIAVFILIVWAVRWSARQANPQRFAHDGLLARGLEARGLILQSSSTFTETTLNGQRYELRDLVMDVEVLGQAPYEVSITPMIPRICEATPGAALDLRVDPKNPNNIVIVGPAGSSGWLYAAPWLGVAPPPAPWQRARLNGLNAGKRRSGTLLVILLLVFGASVVFAITMAGRQHPEPVRAPAARPTSAAPPPHPAPPSRSKSGRPGH
jgi:hypothetical protein